MSSHNYFKRFFSLLRHRSSSLILRSVLFGRGRRKRFGIAPAIRTTKKITSAYPLLTNCAFYGTLYVGAELSTQTIRHLLSTTPTSTGATTIMHHNSNNTNTSNNNNNKKIVYDLSSVKRYAVFGTIIYPPILHKWYIWLDSKFPKGNLIKKLFLDQFILTPVLVAMFYIGMSAMEGKEDWTEECRDKFAHTFFYDCIFWLPMQAINFKFIPNAFRIVFIAICSFVWLNVLCTIKNAPLSGKINADLKEKS